MHRIRRWWTRRRVVVAGTVISCLLAPPAVFATVLVVSYSGDIAEHARTRGRDALWLGHAWVDGRRTAADLATLSERLRSTGIRDVYVHIGPLSDDGTLDATRYPAAPGFRPCRTRPRCPCLAAIGRNGSLGEPVSPARYPLPKRSRLAGLGARCVWV